MIGKTPQWKWVVAALCAGAFVACGGGVVVDDGAQNCDYHGITYKNGAAFPADDGCNTCNCVADGSVACTEKACFPTCTDSCASGFCSDGLCVSVCG